jgi:hypothetical protein
MVWKAVVVACWWYELSDLMYEVLKIMEYLEYIILLASRE